jgi:hypothetical protein
MVLARLRGIGERARTILTPALDRPLCSAADPSSKRASRSAATTRPAADDEHERMVRLLLPSKGAVLAPRFGDRSRWRPPRTLKMRLRRGHVLRFEPGTQRIVGLTVINARWLLDRDGRLTITIPETVEASADDLAAALAAA